MFNSRLYNSRLNKSKVYGQFDPRQYVSYYSTEKEIEIWKQIFDQFDTDSDGRLAPRDLLEAMTKYEAYHPKRNRIYQTMAAYDKDQSGNIDFRQFLRMIFQKPYEKDTSEDIKQVFNEIDTQMKGYIDAQDLRNLASQLKQSFTQDEIQLILRKLDPKRSGKITLTAFVDFTREKIV